MTSEHRKEHSSSGYGHSLRICFDYRTCYSVLYFLKILFCVRRLELVRS